MRKGIGVLFVAVLVLALTGATANAFIFPGAGYYRASVVDRSNLFNDSIPGNPGLEPAAYGALPLVGDENRTVFSVDAINHGQPTSDGVAPMIIDMSPTEGVDEYNNDQLAGMLYDINILPTSSGIGAPFSLANPWLLNFGPGTRYTSDGSGTDGTWTDLVPGIHSNVVATTGTGYGGLLVVYSELPGDTDFAQDPDGTGPTPPLGPNAWSEGSIVAPDPSLTASDAFPSISDVVPFLVAVLAPLPQGYGLPPGTVSLEVITGLANSGLSFANIIGGWGAGQFDTDVFGAGLDIRLEFEPIIGAGPIDGWQTASDDPVQFSIIPEPATMSLLGLGLAGLGAVRRKRRK